MTRRTYKAGRTDAGYTYISMLVVLVALALAAQVTFTPTGTEVRRAAEEEMIFRGLAYARAIEDYYFADPNDLRYPDSLNDLLDDPRPGGGRHIRRLYETGIGAQFEEIDAVADGIMGVSVTSPYPPFRSAQLPLRVTLEENSDGYTVWSFVASLD